MQNIIMIGMPGSGKSTLGRILAQNFQYDYLDTDQIIISRHRKPLKALIAEHGIEGFIQLEGTALSSLQIEHTVIATGGSAVYSEAAMKHLKSKGVIVYLCYAIEDIAARVGDLMNRGVVCRNNCETLEQLFEERVPLYERYADITVHLEHASMGQSIQRLIGAIRAYQRQTGLQSHDRR